MNDLLRWSTAFNVLSHGFFVLGVAVGTYGVLTATVAGVVVMVGMTAWALVFALLSGFTKGIAKSLKERDK